MKSYFRRHRGLLWLGLQIGLLLRVQAQDSLSSIGVSGALLREHVYILAADSLQGRQTGHEGQIKAANYCAKILQKCNLRPIFRDSTAWSYYQLYSLRSYYQGVFGINSPMNSQGTTPRKFLRHELVEPQAIQEKGYQYLTAHNVGGVILGTDLKSEVLVISAHYDHLGKDTKRIIYHGADDNASGTATVLGIAATFDSLSKVGIRPRRTVLFVLFSGEEGGLVGSKYFVSHSPFALKNITANLNVDMVGRIDPTFRKKPNYCFVVGPRIFESLRAVLEKANAATVKLTLDYSHDSENDPQQYFFRSDHYNFARYGVPILFFLDGEHPDYHSPRDRAERINYEILQKRASLVFHTAWALANPAKP